MQCPLASLYGLHKWLLFSYDARPKIFGPDYIMNSLNTNVCPHHAIYYAIWDAVVKPSEIGLTL